MTDVILLSSSSSQSPAMPKKISETYANFFYSSSDPGMSESDSFVSASDETIIDESYPAFENKFKDENILSEEYSIKSFSAQSTSKNTLKLKKKNKKNVIEIVDNVNTSSLTMNNSSSQSYYSNEVYSTNESSTRSKPECSHAKTKVKRIYVETQVVCDDDDDDDDDDDEYYSDSFDEEMNSSDRKFIAESQYTNDISIYRIAELKLKKKSTFKKGPHSDFDFESSSTS